MQKMPSQDKAQFLKYILKEIDFLEKLCAKQKEERLATILLFLKTYIELGQDEELYSLIAPHMYQKLRQQDY